MSGAGELKMKVRASTASAGIVDVGKNVAGIEGVAGSRSKSSAGKVKEVSGQAGGRGAYDVVTSCTAGVGVENRRAGEGGIDG